MQQCGVPLAVQGHSCCDEWLGTVGSAHARALISNSMTPHHTLAHNDKFLTTATGQVPAAVTMLSTRSHWLFHGGRRQVGGWRIQRLTMLWIKLGALSLPMECGSFYRTAGCWITTIPRGDLAGPHPVDCLFSSTLVSEHQWVTAFRLPLQVGIPLIPKQMYMHSSQW